MTSRLWKLKISRHALRTNIFSLTTSKMLPAPLHAPYMCTWCKQYGSPQFSPCCGCNSTKKVRHETPWFSINSPSFPKHLYKFPCSNNFACARWTVNSKHEFNHIFHVIFYIIICDLLWKNRPLAIFHENHVLGMDQRRFIVEFSGHSLVPRPHLSRGKGSDELGLNPWA